VTREQLISGQQYTRRTASVNMSVTNPNQFKGQFLPHDSMVGELHRLNISFIVATSAFIAVRLIVRAFVVKHVAADDYLMVAAGLFATAFSTMAIVGMLLLLTMWYVPISDLTLPGLRYGLGRHVWDLPQDAALVEKIKKVVQVSGCLDIWSDV
jgi:hypothetical protein